MIRHRQTQTFCSADPAEQKQLALWACYGSAQKYVAFNGAAVSIAVAYSLSNRNIFMTVAIG
jgi:hypothetical protein